MTTPIDVCWFDHRTVVPCHYNRNHGWVLLGKANKQTPVVPKFWTYHPETTDR